MDVTQDLADYAAKHTTATLERSEPVQVDAGLLAAFDNTPVDPVEYSNNLNPHLLALTLTSTQSLLSALFNLPTHSSDAGPTAELPAPTTLLPREKPLPKPKVPTKWERFAKEKGISHKKREKDVWDDEKQAWVARWGRDGKNKEKEDQWLSEVKAGADADDNPAATAKKERKERTAKNAAQHARNLSLAQHGSGAASTSAAPATSTSSSSASKAAVRTLRKAELERSLLISKTATASLGKFDKKIEGEPKAKGIKRKFEANLGDAKHEKESAMDVLKRVERGEGKKSKGKKGGEGEEGGVNVRKAVRFEARQEKGNRVVGRGGGGKGGSGKRGGKR